MLPLKWYFFPLSYWSGTFKTLSMETLVFWANPSHSRLARSDSAEKRPFLSGFGIDDLQHFQESGSFKAKSYRDNTSATCRISYQMNEPQFAEIRPHIKHVGWRSLLVSNNWAGIPPRLGRLNCFCIPGKAANSFNMIRFTYGHGSSLRPGPRNLPCSLETAQGQPFSFCRLNRNLRLFGFPHLQYSF